METWPVGLPQHLGADTKITDDESRVTSQMDAGPASVRNRFTAITQTITSSIVFTGSELSIFNTFFRTTLAHGSLSFLWTHPVTGESVAMRFKKKPEWSCIRPGQSVNSRVWQGSLELEVLP